MANANEAHELLNNTELWQNDPGKVQQIILDALEAGSEGQLVIVDPTNPAVGLVESSVINSTAFMRKLDVTLRKQYPILATNEDELYRHMSDVDYLDRFSSPARATFVYTALKKEVYEYAEATDVPNVRKLTIPRDTEFTLGSYTFTMQYPIDIRIMPHNGLQIVYDTTKTSPIESLETNIVKWNVYSDSNLDFLRIEIPMPQVKIRSYTEGLSATGSFTFDAEHNDLFYYCRVYMSNQDGEWTEIKTTHTEQVYDPNKITAVLKTYDGFVRVHIPPVYFTTNQVGSEIRIDVYETKGPLDFDMESFILNEYKMTPMDRDGDSDPKYFEALGRLTTVGVFAIGRVQGGSKGLTFNELRERAIYDSLGNQQQPITDANMTARLETMGYKGIKVIDNVTDLNFIASRALPNPGLPKNSSGAGCLVGSFSTKLEDLAQYETVADNLQRVTLLPTTLFKSVDGLISIVPKGEVDIMLSYTKEALAATINSNSFFYTPFHYVFDTNYNRFSIRPYYLDGPKVTNRRFVFENTSAALQVGTQSFGLFKRDWGYELIVATRSGDGYKALSDDRCFAQLAFKGPLESTYGHINGTMIGIDPQTNERTFSFRLESNWDIDEKHRIFINNFKMYTEDTIREIATGLVTDFYLTYIVTDLVGVEATPIDNQIGDFLLPTTIDTFSAVVREEFTIRLGNALPRLWQMARPIISEYDYEHWAVNVPWVYETDIWERDPDGSRKITWNAGVPEFTKLHSAGDPVYEEDGVTQKIRHYAGELKYDVNGQPIPINPRGILLLSDITLIDGRYYFATHAETVTYRNEIPKTIVEWLDTHIDVLQKRALERAQLYFYPMTTAGDIRVIAGGGDPITIPCEQSLSVTFYVDRATKDNILLQNNISDTTRNELDLALQPRTVSVLDISARLRTVLGDGIFGATISGFGGARNINTMTVVDSSQRPMIRKRLVVDSDGFLSVQDDITIDFQLHSIS